MSRVINPESAGKERAQLTRGVVLALRELMRQRDVNETTRDLAAFIAIALNLIWKTIDLSVQAWEKRGYWLKADRFRMEWEWTCALAESMSEAVLTEDWGKVAQVSGQVALKLQEIKLPQRNRLGSPWVGAWEQLRTLTSAKNQYRDA